MNYTDVSTEDCQLYLTAYYGHKDIMTHKEDWILERKYKNFHGFTCRDFKNHKEDIRAIVVLDKVKGDLSVMENSSYECFLEEMATKPLFYYVPVISNDGFVFFFEKSVYFDAKGVLDPQGVKQRVYLMKKLQSIFDAHEIGEFGETMFISFPKQELDEIVWNLEHNKLSFNAKLFDAMDANKYQLVVPEIALCVFKFPEDQQLNSEQAITTLFSVASHKGRFKNEHYARIRILLKKINIEEFDMIKEIVMGFRPEHDERLLSLIEAERNRKKSALLKHGIFSKNNNSK